MSYAKMVLSHLSEVLLLPEAIQADIANRVSNSIQHYARLAPQISATTLPRRQSPDQTLQSLAPPSSGAGLSPL
jgi:hypothetical protein